MEKVRFSQMSPQVRAKYNTKLIGIVNEIKTICDENNIRWFVGYGACIGAVRHKGCIPWDDDIDVCMPRPDYDRFLEACKKRQSDDYELVKLPESPDFFEHFARMYDKNSTLYFYKQLKHVGGIFIDIFPLDGAGNDIKDKKVAKNLKHINFWQAILHQSHFYHSCSQRLGYLMKGKLSLYIVVLLTTIFRKKFQKISLQKIEQALMKYPYATSDYVMFYERTYGLKNMIRKEWIMDTILVPFENIQVPIPKNYHAYLTSIYGDYMTPPPEDKRDARHVFAYLNMERRLSYNELMDVLSK